MIDIYSKTQISFYRKMLIAALIDAGIATVPLLVDATGMSRRTIQEAIKTLSDFSIECAFKGAARSGAYYISDWGIIKKQELKNHLQHYSDVLKCQLSDQLLVDIVEGIPMSDKKILQALFNQQRLQIMSLAVHQKEYTDAYLYAWSSGVYPLFEDTDGSVIEMPHESYADLFPVSQDKVDKLSKILDDAWLNKKVPTFYELEDNLEVRYSDEWSRSDLIKICRYLYLQGTSWDEDFWQTLITPMKHPSEAKSITRKFDRKKDIYFM